MVKNRIVRMSTELDNVVDELQKRFSLQTGTKTSKLKMQQSLAQILNETGLHRRVNFRLRKKQIEIKL